MAKLKYLASEVATVSILEIRLKNDYIAWHHIQAQLTLYQKY